MVRRVLKQRVLLVLGVGAIVAVMLFSSISMSSARPSGAHLLGRLVQGLAGLGERSGRRLALFLVVPVLQRALPGRRVVQGVPQLGVGRSLRLTASGSAEAFRKIGLPHEFLDERCADPGRHKPAPTAASLARGCRRVLSTIGLPDFARGISAG